MTGWISLVIIGFLYGLILWAIKKADDDYKKKYGNDD